MKKHILWKTGILVGIWIVVIGGAYILFRNDNPSFFSIVIFSLLGISIGMMLFSLYLFIESIVLHRHRKNHIGISTFGLVFLFSFSVTPLSQPISFVSIVCFCTGWDFTDPFHSIPLFLKPYVQH